MSALDPQSEQNRLEALAQYDILDTPNEEAFDRVTRLVRRVLKVPMATVTFLDGHRQWHKSRQGVAASENERSSTLCNTTIRSPDPLVVSDLWEDDRFAASPLVTEGPRLRFYAGVPLRTSGGQNIGTLCAVDTVPHTLSPDEIETLVDLASVVMSELELRREASTDLLTGSLSRRAFRNESTRALNLAHRYHHDLSLIAFDLDHFKVINDRYGHAAGDRVLTECVSACRKILRASDLLGRLGGEEFAVLLPHADKQAAILVAEKLRKAIADLSFTEAGGVFHPTASFGITSLGTTLLDIDQLLQVADEALYAAKRAGRNRCMASGLGSAATPALGRRVLKAGRIVFNSGNSVIDCTVRRLSDTGATLAFANSLGIPEQFRLMIQADSLSRPCESKRRAGAEIDVVFA